MGLLAVDVVYLFQRETAILQCSLVDDAPMLDMRATRFYAISVTGMTVSATTEVNMSFTAWLSLSQDWSCMCD